jgi:predicted transcriptional regulator
MQNRIARPRTVNYACGMGEKMANRLRKAINESGLSAHALAKATGVPQPTITRFLNGADMRLSNADNIASFLGLELRGKRR